MVMALAVVMSGDGDAFESRSRSLKIHAVADNDALRVHPRSTDPDKVRQGDAIHSHAPARRESTKYHAAMLCASPPEPDGARLGPPITNAGPSLEPGAPRTAASSRPAFFREVSAGFFGEVSAGFFREVCAGFFRELCAGVFRAGTAGFCGEVSGEVFYT